MGAVQQLNVIPPAACLDKFLTRAVQEEPQRIALVTFERCWTYAQLSQQVDDLVDEIKKYQLPKYACIACVLDNCSAFVKLACAASRLGLIFVPIHHQHQAVQICEILKQTQARILYTTRERASYLQETDTESIETLRICDSCLSDLDGIVSVQVCQEISQDVQIPSDVAVLFFTSGSTGRPKGIMVTHRNLMYGAMSMDSVFAHRSEDCLLAALPMSFDAGFSQLTTAFYAKARLCLIRYWSAQQLMYIVQKHQVTGLLGVPSLCIQLAQVQWPKPMSLRYMAVTGGRMPVAMIEQLQKKQPKMQFYVMYGLTEAFRSCVLPPACFEKKPRSFGKAIPYAQVLTCRSNGDLCRPYEQGELVHEGVLVTAGYWNDTAATKAKFRARCVASKTRAVWSGDIVYQDEDGFFFFVGRRDLLMKVCGYRIAPETIEQQLMQHPEVEVATVFSQRKAQHEQQIVAYIQSQTNAPDVVIDNIRDFLATKLPRYMLPRMYRVLSKMPLNAHGKPDIQKLKRL